MEAAVALAVFTIGMLGLGGAFSQIVKANALSRQKQVGILLAERQMAQFRIAEIGDLTRTNGVFEAPFDDYTWQAHFVYRSEDTEIMDVLIEVQHRSGTGVQLWSQVAVPHGQ